MKKKSKMDFKDILNRDYYRSIITLLAFYQVQRDENGDLKLRGLRQIHLRYVLMKEPGLYEPTYKKVKKFFDNHSNIFPELNLEFLYKYGGVVKDCIKSPQKLTNYLTTLKEIGIIEKKGKQPHSRYVLTPKYMGEMKKIRIKSRVDRWHFQYIVDSYYFKDILDNSDDLNLGEEQKYLRLSRGSSWVLYGLPPEKLDELAKEEKDKLCHYLNEIEKNLWAVMELRYSKMKISAKRFTEKVKKNKIPIEVKYPNIAFFFEASRPMVY